MVISLLLLTLKAHETRSGKTLRIFFFGWSATNPSTGNFLDQIHFRWQSGDGQISKVFKHWWTQSLLLSACPSVQNKCVDIKFWMDTKLPYKRFGKLSRSQNKELKYIKYKMKSVNCLANKVVRPLLKTLNLSSNCQTPASSINNYVSRKTA